MSKSGVIGAVGLHSQSGKGVASASLKYVPSTSVNLNTVQNTQAYPPEVGGSYFLRGAYKAGASASGDMSFLIRPESIGHFLYGMAGLDVVTPVPAQTGAYQHVFTPFAPGVNNDLPWFTLLKNLAFMEAEQYVDCKLSTLRMDLSKQSVATASAGWFGITPTEVSVPTSGAINSATDATVAFTGCQATVSLVNEIGNVAIGSASILPERVTVDFQSRISEDEYVVGSFFPQDITLLSRAVNVSYDTVIRDADLIRAVYRNGGSGSWDPTIFRGHLTLTLNSAQVIGATTQPYSLQLDFPGLDFLMMGVPMNGGQLIRANLSTQVSLGTSGADTFTITLINGTASY